MCALTTLSSHCCATNLLHRRLPFRLHLYLQIPEGMAVAAPIYVSTGSRWAAMKYCLLSSICEPLAAVLFGWFASGYLTHYVVAALNAAVSGIMICLCLVELIPTAAAHVGPKVRPSCRCRDAQLFVR